MRFVFAWMVLLVVSCENPRNQDETKFITYYNYDSTGTLVDYTYYTHDSTLYTGDNKQYYLNGVLKQEGFIYKGKLQGIDCGYYEDGTTKYILNYEKGALKGVSYGYYPNGNLKFMVSMKDNVRFGDSYFFYESGVQEKHEFNFDGGKVLFRAKYDTVGRLVETQGTAIYMGYPFHDTVYVGEELLSFFAIVSLPNCTDTFRVVSNKRGTNDLKFTHQYVYKNVVYNRDTFDQAGVYDFYNIVTYNDTLMDTLFSDTVSYEIVVKERY